jgi:hypothetical protein
MLSMYLKRVSLNPERLVSSFQQSGRVILPNELK